MHLDSKNKNYTQKTAFNLIASIVQYGSSLIVALCINPILVSKLGSDIYGLWKICQRFITFGCGGDGRTSQALKFVISNKQVESDNVKKKYVSCAVIVWLIYFPLIAVGGGLSLWLYPYLIKNLPFELFFTVRLTLAILLVTLLLEPIKAIPEAVLIGMHIAYKSVWVNSFGLIIGGIFMVTAICIGYGIVGLAVAMLLALIINIIAVIVIAKKSLSWFGLQRPTAAEFKQFFKLSGWSLAWTFINKSMLLSDILIIGLVSSTLVVSSYSLSLFAVQTSLSLVALFVSAGLPRIGGLIGNKEYLQASQIHSEILSVSWLLTTALGSLILLLNESFVGLWVGNENFIGYWENIFMVIAMTQLIFIRNDAFVVDVSLRLKSKVLLGGISACLAIVLAYTFSQIFKSPVIGLLTGLIAGRIILSIYYPTLAKKAVKKEGDIFFVSIAKPAIVTFILFALASFFSLKLKISNWILLISCGFSALIIFMVLALFLGFSRQQRCSLTIRCTNLLPLRHKK